MPSEEIYEIILSSNVPEYKRNVDVLTEKIFSKVFKPLLLDLNETSHEKVLEELCKKSNQEAKIDATSDDIWIFGYGSLMWKADFPYIDKKNGFIRGYQRLFYQNSIDHRGTSTQPGRVVTLIPSDNISSLEDKVFGVAYRIAKSQKDDVLRHLDYREKNGYKRCTLEFTEYPEGSSESFKVTMYIATTDNESYAGHINCLEAISEQILTSYGPSGPNQEYLFNLANTMRLLFPGVHDDHLFELESMVKMKGQNKARKTTELVKEKIKNILTNSDVDRALKEIKSLQQHVENKDFECIYDRI